MPGPEETADGAAPHRLTEVTRRAILELLLSRGRAFHGRLEIPEFFGRLWDLEAMPPPGSPMSDMAGDLWQHTVRNYDYDDECLLYE